MVVFLAKEASALPIAFRAEARRVLLAIVADSDRVAELAAVAVEITSDVSLIGFAKANAIACSGLVGFSTSFSVANSMSM